MEARIRAIRSVTKVFMMTAALSFGFVVVALAIPERRKLEQIEEKLAEARRSQKVIFDERDAFQVELKALREDPEYLELHARDRLGYYLPGERVLRFKQD
ncbi:MAG: FtsB family cell division protein [Luteolibacter sp.]